MANRVLAQGVSYTALAAVAATGAGSTIVLPGVLSRFTMQTIVTGAPSAVSCKLQGSLDGTNWFDLATSTSTTGDAQHAVDKPCRYVRGNLGTLTAGTAPTVTALVAAA